MKNFLGIGIVLAILWGCGNKNEMKTDVPPPVATPPVSVPRTPPPVPPNAVDDGIQRPTPGEANDHSSPSFKSGGKPDLKK